MVLLCALSNAKMISITPNTRWAEELNKKALEAPKHTSVLERSAYSIKEFISVHYDNSLPVISRNMRRLLLFKILKGVKTSYFRRISRGVVEVVANAISELKKNSITPANLGEILETRGGPREADLLASYEAYEKALLERRFKDEDDLYQNLKNVRFDSPPELRGFDTLKPWMRSLNNGKIIFSDIKTPKKIEPEVLSLNSPFAERKFLRARIDALLKEGLAPEEIAVYLPSQSLFAWELATTFTKEIQFSIATSTVSSSLFNELNLPEEASVNELIHISSKRLSDIYGSLSKNMNDRLSARDLCFIDTVNKDLTRCFFEAKEIEMNENISRDDFLDLLSEIMNTPPTWPERLPFRLIPWEDAGLYEHKIAILPHMNEGIFPSLGANISFFSEPDTLSTKPDTRIDEIFPKREIEIKSAVRRFMAASSGKTMATFHTHNANGKDAAPSPLIMKYGHKEAPFVQLSMPIVRSSSCGTNFSSKEPLALLKEQVDGMTHSATKLEEYGNCPFSFFCRRILNIEPPDEITPEVQPKDRGTLIHESLELFFITHCNIYNSYISKDVPESDLKKLVVSSVEKSFEARKDITSKYHKDMVEHLRRRAVSYITVVLTNEAEILRDATQRPSHFELEFNGELSKGVKIKGFIDRIDSDDRTFTVMDYKTGETPSVKSGIKNGTKLQMPIYTYMAEKVLKKEPAAALLYSIKEHKRATGIIKKSLKENVMGKRPSRITVTDDEWNDLIETGIKTAIRYVGDIKSGHFESSPEKCPGYCEWKDVCRYNGAK